VRWTILPYPRYSPDLVPSDLHLFGPLQDALEDDVLWMMRAETRCVCVCVCVCVCEELQCCSKECYVAGLRHLMRRWKKCVDNGGDLA